MSRLALVVALAAPAVLGLSFSCIPSTPDESNNDAGKTGTGGGSSGGGSGTETRTDAGGGTGGTGASGAQTGSGGSAQASGGGTGTVGSGGGTGAAGGGGTGGGSAVGTGGRGGGNAAGSGGTNGSGGSGAASGGRSGTGSGGTGTGGAATGTGGAAATSCNLPNHTGSGSFTYYYFAQGTAKDGNGYRTACGYYGTANGQTDTIQNIASKSPANATYFAAIPGTSGFNTSSKCGSCVQITGQNGKVIIATVADECPYGSDGNNNSCANNPAGHLDLSKAAFDQLGYSRGDPTGTTWKFVPCPVTGNIVARLKSGNQNELFIENTILAITAVQGASRTSYGAWHFNSNLAVGQSVQLTDALGRTLTIELASTSQGMNQDTGKQFPACQ